MRASASPRQSAEEVKGERRRERRDMVRRTPGLM